MCCLVFEVLGGRRLCRAAQQRGRAQGKFGTGASLARSSGGSQHGAGEQGEAKWQCVRGEKSRSSPSGSV